MKCLNSCALEKPLVLRSPISLLRRLNEAWETVLPTSQATKKTGSEKIVNVNRRRKMLCEKLARGPVRLSLEQKLYRAASFVTLASICCTWAILPSCLNALRTLDLSR